MTTCTVCGGGESVALVTAHDEVTGADYAAARCAACGTVFTTPRPADLATAYPEGEYYAYRPVAATVGERARWATIARVAYGAIARMRPGVMLDVGCGVGRFARHWRGRGWTVHGVEPDPRGAEAARGSGMEVHTGTLSDPLPWEAGTFDAVIFNHSLEHTPDPVGDLRRARELLRAGGIVAVSVPNFGSWQRERFGAHWLQLDMPRHVTHFERATLEAAAARAGLAEVRTTTTTMGAGLPTSLERSTGRTLPGPVKKAAGYVTALALAPAGPLGGGDCLNLMARRAPRTGGPGDPGT
jgi:SAM-dependent methyltransferase